MIRSLNIKNFKGFRDLSLPRLTRFTLVWGANNVGKSSLLEAIFLLYNTWNDDLFLKQYNLRNLSYAGDLDYSICSEFFYDLKTDVPISIEAETSRRKMQRISCNLKYVLEANSRRGFYLDQSSEQNIMPVMTIEYSEEGKQKYSRVLPEPRGGGVSRMGGKPLLDIPKVWFVNSYSVISDASLLSDLDVKYQKEMVVEYLRIIEPQLKDLSIGLRGGRSEIYADVGLPRKLPVKLMGDATQRLLSFLLVCAHANGGILLIDEIENGLHWAVHAKVWDELCHIVEKFDCQVIATTHSYEFLEAAFDGIAANLREDLSYIRLDKIRDDVVQKSFSSDDMKWSFQAKAEVR